MKLELAHSGWRSARRRGLSATRREVMRPRDGTARLLRGIGAFEAFKGLLALAAAAGLLGYVHHDLRQAAAALIGRIGLRPGDRYPAMALVQLDHWLSADLRPLLLAGAGYALLRFTEAYGLWHARPWGETLGALSGTLYVPFELQHLIHRPSAAAAAMLALNLAVVGFLAWRLGSRRAALPRLSERLP